MNDKSIEELEAELARQDAELERASAAFRAAQANHVCFEVPDSFLEELEEICRPRLTAPSHVVFGLRA